MLLLLLMVKGRLLLLLLMVWVGQLQLILVDHRVEQESVLIASITGCILAQSVADAAAGSSTSTTATSVKIICGHDDRITSHHRCLVRVGNESHPL